MSSVVVVLPPSCEDLPCHPERNAYVRDMLQEIIEIANRPQKETDQDAPPVCGVIEHTQSCSEEDLLTFHDRDYVEYVRNREFSNKDVTLDDNDDGGEEKVASLRKAKVARSEYLAPRAGDEDFGLNKDCTPFMGMWRTATLAVGMTLRAVDELVTSGDAVRFASNWFGGRHHAHADRASGFCFFNDVVLAAQRFRKCSELRKVLIVDLDAHHGDGTQTAFYYDPFVYTFSIHARGEFPFTGLKRECGAGRAVGTCWNIPVPAGSTDSIWVPLALRALDDIHEKFTPDVVIVVCGSDCCQGDPIGALNVSISGVQAICRRCATMSAKKILFLGAGGYVQTTAARLFGCVTRDMIALGAHRDLPALASHDDPVPETLKYFSA